MIGVDGTSEGWITAYYTGDTWDLDFIESLSEIDANSALIDIPIGLKDNSIRECDQRAREFLSPERHYSIFNCPIRDAVYADNYEEACDINEEKTCKRISKQVWNIVPKIKEADKYRGETDLMESHPEIFFKSLEPKSVKNSKRDKKGLNDRLKVLNQFGDTSVINENKFTDASKDDLVDAMVLSLGRIFELKKIGGNGKNEGIFRPVDRK